MTAALDNLRAAAAAAANDDEAAAVAADIRAYARDVAARRWAPYPWQHPHHHPDGWVSQRAPGKDICDPRCALLPAAEVPVHGWWLQRGGRGTGKTEGASHYVNAHALGPACDPRVPGGHRFTIVGPTQPDAVSACVTGVSGLQAINPAVTISTGREGTIVRWPNGAVGRVLGGNTAADVNRARAWSNVCLWWIEEAAAIPHLGGLTLGTTEPGMLDQAPFTLRLGQRPHSVITTTPKNRPEVAHIIATAAVQTWGRTEDADRLPAPVRQSYEVRYRGTTLGRQELDGEELGDVEGALWVMDRPALVDGAPNPDERPGIENDRLPQGDITWTSHDPHAPPPAGSAPTVQRTVVAVDPPGGRTECGITVVGTIGQHGYVLADLSLAGPPDTWAKVVIGAYIDYGCEGIAAEHAYGGDMVDDVIATRVSAYGLDSIPIFRVPTKVGKRLRAEPVQALYQQHRVHHVGPLPGLEGELTTWVPGESADSPNRLDALVHGLTFLLIRAGAGKVGNPARSPARINRPGQSARTNPWGR